MKIRQITALTIMIFAITACNDSLVKYESPDFEIVNNSIDFEYVTDAVPYNVINDLFVYEGRILVMAYNIADKNYLHIYDSETGNHISSGIREGGGPGEILFRGYPYLDTTSGIFHLYDKIKNSYLKFDITHGIELLDETPLLLARSQTNSFPIDEKWFLTTTSHSPQAIIEMDMPRIYIDDHCIDTLATYDKYPIEEQSMERFCIYSDTFGSRADISPDRKHLAIGILYGCILETFEIGDEIKATGVKYFHEPVVKYANWTIQPDISQQYGFQDIALSNRYIYTSYDGKEHDEFIAHERFNNIAIFSLSGEPVSISNIGQYNIERICPDERNGLLYAIITGESGESRIVKIKLNDLIPEP